VTPDELVARRDLSLDTKGFETTCRERYGRPPTDEELRRALLRFPEWKATARAFRLPE
jgi:hypothetical protein